MLTRRHRLIFRPMEKLQIQKIGAVLIESADMDDTLDIKYKPGLYRQLDAFLLGELDQMCSVREQASLFEIYMKMANYC